MTEDPSFDITIAPEFETFVAPVVEFSFPPPFPYTVCTDEGAARVEPPAPVAALLAALAAEEAPEAAMTMVVPVKLAV